ncbi:hypothetical protein GCM10010274_24710 [Streptomyces lavendofoliae]|uniref:Uncharacterized protein n=1 Tax=Streptomyces lavendofoliae TaxID=67314 RepID=A0A918HXB7_9ACTN|nr:hypothetical protein GCM10010274_24710 [Streptomyces lavendofoliae]
MGDRRQRRGRACRGTRARRDPKDAPWSGAARARAPAGRARRDGPLGAAPSPDRPAPDAARAYDDGLRPGKTRDIASRRRPSSVVPVLRRVPSPLAGLASPGGKDTP